VSNLEANKRTVVRYFEILTRNDVGAMMALYDDSMTLHVPGNTLISGTFNKAQLAQFASQVLDAFPKGLVFTVTGMVAEGDKVAVQAESRGVHASGKPYHNQYHFLITVRDGKIFESREYMDTQQVTDVICGGQRPPAPR
jgi:ketosteroid isomerase-like protein